MPKIIVTSRYIKLNSHKLFFKWGIQFEETYSIEEKSERKVHALTCDQRYADCREVEAAVLEQYPPKAETLPTASRSQKLMPIDFAEDYENPDAEEILLRKHPPKTKRSS